MFLLTFYMQNSAITNLKQENNFKRTKFEENVLDSFCTRKEAVVSRLFVYYSRAVLTHRLQVAIQIR